MRRLGLVGTLAVLVVLPLGGAERPLPLHGLSPATPSPTAILRETSGSRLVRLDPSTLAVVRRSQPIGFDGGWVRSPDGKLVAVASESRTGMTSTLRFADAKTLRWAKRGVFLGGNLTTAMWLTPRTIVAVVGGLIVERIDATAKRVVSNTILDGIVIGSGRTASGLVLLVASQEAVGPVTVLAVDPEGGLRSTRLGQIRAGVAWTDRNAYVGTQRTPALAVDPSGTAYVFDPDGLAAKIDLRSLAVEYHRTTASLLARVDAWLEPAAQAKAVDGSIRTAKWLGDGLVTLTGANAVTTAEADGSHTVTVRPAGLSIVDTSDWTERTIDPGASDALVADGLLLATGGTWRYGEETAAGAGIGVAAYGTDGRLRWRFDDGGRRNVAWAYGSLALVYGDGAKPSALVDLRTGLAVRSLAAVFWPQLLLGSGS